MIDLTQLSWWNLGSVPMFQRFANLSLLLS
jgi:hypothetical protein